MRELTSLTQVRGQVRRVPGQEGGREGSRRLLLKHAQQEKLRNRSELKFTIFLSSYSGMNKNLFCGAIIAPITLA